LMPFVSLSADLYVVATARYAIPCTVEQCTFDPNFPFESFTIARLNARYHALAGKTAK
jgi:hypothetical protein